MRRSNLHLVSSAFMIMLSLTALVTVVSGLIWPPPKPEMDEGAQAHLFQLSIAGLVPATIFMLGTTDWRRPERSAWTLVIALVTTGLAFAGLFYLENLR